MNVFIDKQWKNILQYISKYVYSVIQEPAVFQNSDIPDFMKGPQYIHFGYYAYLLFIPSFCRVGIWWNHQHRSITSSYKQIDYKVLS